jgi:hypothetical protein
MGAPADEDLRDPVITGSWELHSQEPIHGKLTIYLDGVPYGSATVESQLQAREYLMHYLAEQEAERTRLLQEMQDSGLPEATPAEEADARRAQEAEARLSMPAHHEMCTDPDCMYACEGMTHGHAYAKGGRKVANYFSVKYGQEAIKAVMEAGTMTSEEAAVVHSQIAISELDDTSPIDRLAAAQNKRHREAQRKLADGGVSFLVISGPGGGGPLSGILHGLQDIMRGTRES